MEWVYWLRDWSGVILIFLVLLVGARQERLHVLMKYELKVLRDGLPE